jgi:hypothetical protein
MTLITRLSQAFTDTSLPILQKDPVIPNAGGVLLYDFKNVATYSGAAGAIGSYDSMVNNNWPTFTGDASKQYDPATGRVSTTSISEMPIQDASNRVFADTTASYCISIWVYIPATMADAQGVLRLGAGTGGNNPNFSLLVNTGTTPSRVKFFRPASTDSTTFQNSYVETVTTDSVVRLGYTWQKNSGNWQHKGSINNGAPSAWVNSTFGTGSDGVQDQSAWSGGLFGNGGAAWSSDSPSIYRLYVENLSVSGRTPEQVWDADWARGNGRFS